MNWFTRHPNAVVREDYGSICPHLKVGQVAAICSKENDGLGAPESSYFCSECWDKIQAEVDEDTDYCHDCGQEKKMKELTEWKWYDFYAPQGDEPLLICDDCWNSDKHKERRAHDTQQLNDEMGYNDDCNSDCDGFDDPDDQWDPSDDEYDYDDWLDESSIDAPAKSAHSVFTPRPIMKIKNTKLKFSDLHTGRRIYMAEPGSRVVEGVVMGKPIASEIVAHAFLDRRKVVPGHHVYRDVEPWHNVLFAEKGNSVTENDVYFIHRTQSRHIPIQIGNEVHDFQDIYFMADECRMRAFSKRKQAEVWAAYPKDHLTKLESIFGQ